MNEYIFYTAEGYTYPPLEDFEVDNCQLLGRAFGDNAEDAKKNLFKDNPWIEMCGFDAEEIVCKQLLTDEIKQDFKRVLQYILDDDCKYFQKDGEQSNQIYSLLLKLKGVFKE